MHAFILYRAFLTLGLGLGDILGGLSSLIGIGSGVKNLIGGNQGGSKNSNTYVPTGLGTADQTWQQILGQMQGGISGAGQQITPELAQAFQSLLGVNTSGIQPAGNAAGQQYNALANLSQGASGAMLNQGQGLDQAGQQLWQTALDPQNALRDKLQQQVTDASRAGTSARGIGMGGAAAGIENQDVNNFLLNGNNDHLARQAPGLQGYANAANQSGRQYAGGLTAGALAPQYTTQGAMAPFNAGVTAAGYPMQAANQYTSALSGLNQQYGGLLSSIIPYLNSGQGATNQAFGQGQTGLNNLTTGLNQLGNFGSSSSGSYNPFANLFGSSQSGGATQYSNIPGAGVDYGQSYYGG